MSELVNPESLSDILLEFRSYKIVIQGWSKKTVDEYLLDLRTFARYIIASRQKISPESDDFNNIDISIADAEFFKSIKTTEIYDFLFYTSTIRQNLWAAKARKLSAIKALYKYMTVKKSMQFENPAINIESPKPKKSLPKFLTLEESIMLLETIQNDKESKTMLRDYTIVTLFLNCGMRLSELVGINISDIDRELRSMRVLGKGNKERIIYLNSACREALAEYLNWRLAPEKQQIEDKALFLSSREKRISGKKQENVVWKQQLKCKSTLRGNVHLLLSFLFTTI